MGSPCGNWGDTASRAAIRATPWTSATKNARGFSSLCVTLFFHHGESEACALSSPVIFHQGPEWCMEKRKLGPSRTQVCTWSWRLNNPESTGTWGTKVGMSEKAHLEQGFTYLR
jgi:hypothetical protein